MRDLIIAEARTWIGTPFHHQGRVKGAGCDCIGLCIGVGKVLGLVRAEFDYTGYRRTPTGKTLVEVLRESEFVEEVYEPHPGDILVFKIDIEPQHVAFLSDSNTLIHSYAQARKVCEARYDSVWQKRYVTAFKFKGL
jgi:NlpC/P60 family putative phage cell wall peptidase